MCHFLAITNSHLLNVGLCVGYAEQEREYACNEHAREGRGKGVVASTLGLYTSYMLTVACNFSPPLFSLSLHFSSTPPFTSFPFSPPSSPFLPSSLHLPPFFPPPSLLPPFSPPPFISFPPLSFFPSLPSPLFPPFSSPLSVQ